MAYFYSKKIDNSLWVVGSILIILFLIISVFLGFSFLYRSYTVWEQGMEGKAELAKADWNRQISVREAKAKEESAELLANAEVIRAKGVAQANKIIGDSLNNNESYLKYLWINNLQNEHNQIIYVPTETNLPILESSRFLKKENVNENKN